MERLVLTKTHAERLEQVRAINRARWRNDSEFRTRVTAANRRWMKDHPEKRRQYERKQRAYRRDYLLRRTYGIGLEQYESMRASQGGKCAICSEERVLELDHDHKSGKLRAFLCHSCNVAEGNIRTAQNARRLAEYMDMHR